MRALGRKNAYTYVLPMWAHDIAGARSFVVLECFDGRAFGNIAFVLHTYVVQSRLELYDSAIK